MHARRVAPAAATRARTAPATGLTDRRRLIAAAFSGILPGLGQLYNGDRKWGFRLLVPTLIGMAIVLAIWATSTPTRLAATLVIPSTLLAVLVLNVLVLGWRLLAVLQAFFDRRFQARAGRFGVVGLAIIVTLVALPHLVAGYYGWVAYTAFDKVFSGSTFEGRDDPAVGPGPAADERLNVLLTGIDAGPGRAHALTDTMIVVSLDPVGETVTMVSVPRDMVDVPLGNGNTFGPKLNSLASYASNHPDEFPNGASRALPDAIAALLGIPIHYTAQVDLGGFVRMVDAVGGVDITAAKALADPNYGGFGVGPGWSITKGRHHLDGANALAYARIRKSPGESDFTRAPASSRSLSPFATPRWPTDSCSASRRSSARSAMPSGPTCRRPGCRGLRRWRRTSAPTRRPSSSSSIRSSIPGWAAAMARSRCPT